jgi:HEAT repeat protein
MLKMNLFPIRAALLTCVLTAGQVAAAPAAAADNQEAKLIAVLTSDAAPQDKAISCKRLAICGTKTAVPSLAALLSDEKLASWARIGLEAIPDPAVDAALRDAAGKLQGKLQIGVINSIGVRRDEMAVAWLAQKLKDADPALISAAAAALGRIGGEQAAQALGQALAGATAATLPAICEGALRAADIFITQGKRDKAATLCEQVRSVQTPRHIRMEATRSLIVARQAAGIPLLIELLKSDDAGMVAVAMGLAHDLPGTALTTALTAAVTQLPPEKQVYVIEAIGGRRDKAVVPTLLALTHNSPSNVCIAAIGALTKLGDAAALPRLVEIAVAPDGDAAKAAQSALVKFPAVAADATVIAMLASPDARVRVSGIDIVSRRAAYTAMPTVARVARDDADLAVRIACINAQRELGGLADIAAVVDILVKNRSAEEAQAAEKALATICGRQTDRAACAEKLCVGLTAAQAAQKCALLRLLRSVADARSLQAIRAAMTDTDKDVQDAATRLVCDWNTAEAAPDLLALAKSSPNPTYQLLALRGYLRVSAGKDVPAAQRLTMCKEADPLVRRDDEHKILLGVLGAAADGASLALVALHFDNAALKAEACLAAVAIAERLVNERPDGVPPVMEQVLKLNPDEKLCVRAKAVIDKAKAKAPPAS